MDEGLTPHGLKYLGNMTKARLRWDKEGKEYRSVHAELLVGDGIYARMNPCYCKLKHSNIIDWKISYRSHCLHIVKEFGGFFHELAGLEICT